MEELLGVGFIIFMLFVAPLWLHFHYRSKRELGKGLSEGEYVQLNDLAATADKMAARIKTLEAILDAESPEWRNKV